jgi:hypothetical protein
VWHHLDSERLQRGAMTRQDDQERHDRWKALGIRTDIPHPARVYDYLLGGKDNFAVDREAAEMSLKISPEMRHSARANRQFLVRAVRFLRDNGIRQFLDVGTGLPTSPNTYEVAQAGHPDARVVYVDNDPVVFLHAESLMADNQTTTVVRADLRRWRRFSPRPGSSWISPSRWGCCSSRACTTSRITTTRLASSSVT